MTFEPARFVGRPLVELERCLGEIDQEALAAEWGRVDGRGAKGLDAGRADAVELENRQVHAEDVEGAELPADHPPVHVPDVDLTRYLGGGPFGWAFAGRVRTTGLVVAVKVVSKHPTIRAPSRAATEAVNGLKVRHRNIVRVFEAKPVGEHLISVMELGVGPDLGRGVPDGLDTRAILRQLTSAVQHLVGARLVHGDIKPANIVLRACDGSPYLVDLRTSVDLTADGARTTATTPLFAPPGALGRPVDLGHDPWSLGVTAAVLVSGRLPIEGAVDAHVVLRLGESGQLRESILATLRGCDRSLVEWIEALLDASIDRRLDALHVGSP